MSQSCASPPKRRRCPRARQQTRTRRLCSGHNYAGAPLNEGLTGAPFLKTGCNSKVGREVRRVRNRRFRDLGLILFEGAAAAVEDPELSAFAAHDTAAARPQQLR